ncbi:MAG: hypothetical protein C0518_05455 [Opitutus sp.]|nr:hypothetical protein [Opitutus sp.]
MQGNFKATAALVLLDSVDVPAPHRKKFSDSVAAEFTQIARSNVENSVRAILVGIGLHAVKKSLPRGQFEEWKKSHLTRGGYWTESTARKNASFFMRLSIQVLEELKPSKQEMLALTAGGDVTLSNVTQSGNIRKFIGRLTEFIGERSLNDLLDEFGIKDATSGGGARGTGAIAADTDTLLEDAGQLFINFDQVFLDPNQLKRFTAKQLDDFERQLADRLERLRQLKAKLTRQE